MFIARWKTIVLMLLIVLASSCAPIDASLSLNEFVLVDEEPMQAEVALLEDAAAEAQGLSMEEYYQLYNTAWKSMVEERGQSEELSDRPARFNLQVGDAFDNVEWRPTEYQRVSMLFKEDESLYLAEMLNVNNDEITDIRSQTAENFFSRIGDQYNVSEATLSLWVNNAQSYTFNNEEIIGSGIPTEWMNIYNNDLIITDYDILSQVIPDLDIENITPFDLFPVPYTPGQYQPLDEVIEITPDLENDCDICATQPVIGGGILELGQPTTQLVALDPINVGGVTQLSGSYPDIQTAKRECTNRGVGEYVAVFKPNKPVTAYVYNGILVAYRQNIPSGSIYIYCGSHTHIRLIPSESALTFRTTIDTSSSTISQYVPSFP